MGFREQNKNDPGQGCNFVLVCRLLFSKILQNVEILCVKRKFGGWIFFFPIQHDPTPIQMANRDSDDDKNGRKRRFSISDDAFESDDGRDFMSDDEFEAFVNPSQNKRPGLPGKTKPKDFSRHEVKVRCQPSVAPEPEPVEAPKPVVPTKPALQPCLGCRQPFLRIKGLLL